MLELVNQSDWVAGLYSDWDAARQHQQTTVFKASFHFDEQGHLIPMLEPPELVQADEHYAKPTTSSLKQALETMPFKQGSEIYLYGTACPERENLTAMEVGMGIKFTDGHKWKKVLRVFGERRWKKTLVNYILDEPGYVERIPLQYEYAYGGAETEQDDGYAANLAGMGYNPHSRQLSSELLPRIEIGPNFLTGPTQKTIPAGFAPLPIFWEPRLSEIGDPVDEPMEQGGCPYSESAAPCVHNVAPQDQRFKQTFQGGEVIYLRALVPGVNHQDAVKLTLPTLHPQLYTIINNRTEELTPVCDTVVINTDEKTMSMIFRVGIPWRLTDRRHGWVVLKDLDKEELPYDKESRDVPRMAS